MFGTFDELAGQQAAVQRLRSALATGRLHHALLFTGPDGVGKFRAARILAQVLMCSGGSPELRASGRACGRCPACVRVAEHGHSDVHVLESAASRVEDAEESASGKRPTDMIVVDDVRDATRALHVRPVEGAHKILIVRDADKMNPQAQNALLKTLEEPPGSAHLVLTTSRPTAILLTVLSRCQRVTFRPVPPAEITRMLVRDRGLAEGEAALVAGLAQGSPARAMDTDPQSVVADRDRMADLDRRLSPARVTSVPAAIQLAADLVNEKGALRARLGLLGVWLRDQILVASSARDVEIANTDRRADVEALAAERGLAQVLGRARALHEAERLLAEPYNYNPTMIVEQMCLAFAGHRGRVR